MSIATQIERIQNEVSTQEDLINQIATALQGKAAGGGSSSGSVETCTFTITGSYTIHCINYVGVDGNGNIVSECITPNSPNTITLNCLKDSYVSISHAYNSVLSNKHTGSSLVCNGAYFISLKLTSATATLNITRGGSGGGSSSGAG